MARFRPTKIYPRVLPCETENHGLARILILPHTLGDTLGSIAAASNALALIEARIEFVSVSSKASEGAPRPSLLRDLARISPDATLEGFSTAASARARQALSALQPFLPPLLTLRALSRAAERDFLGAVEDATVALRFAESHSAHLADTRAVKGSLSLGEDFSGDVYEPVALDSALPALAVRALALARLGSDTLAERDRTSIRGFSVKLSSQAGYGPARPPAAVAAFDALATALGAVAAAAAPPSPPAPDSEAAAAPGAAHTAAASADAALGLLAAAVSAGSAVAAMPVLARRAVARAGARRGAAAEARADVAEVCVESACTGPAPAAAGAPGEESLRVLGGAADMGAAAAGAGEDMGAAATLLVGRSALAASVRSQRRAMRQTRRLRRAASDGAAAAADADALASVLADVLAATTGAAVGGDASRDAPDDALAPATVAACATAALRLCASVLAAVGTGSAAPGQVADAGWLWADAVAQLPVPPPIPAAVALASAAAGPPGPTPKPVPAPAAAAAARTALAAWLSRWGRPLAGPAATYATAADTIGGRGGLLPAAPRAADWGAASQLSGGEVAGDGAAAEAPPGRILFPSGLAPLLRADAAAAGRASARRDARRRGFVELRAGLIARCARARAAGAESEPPADAAAQGAAGVAIVQLTHTLPAPYERHERAASLPAAQTAAPSPPPPVWPRAQSRLAAAVTAAAAAAARSDAGSPPRRREPRTWFRAPPSPPARAPASFSTGGGRGPALALAHTQSLRRGFTVRSGAPPPSQWSGADAGAGAGAERPDDTLLGGPAWGLADLAAATEAAPPESRHGKRPCVSVSALPVPARAPRPYTPRVVTSLPPAAALVPAALASAMPALASAPPAVASEPDTTAPTAAGATFLTEAPAPEPAYEAEPAALAPLPGLFGRNFTQRPAPGPAGRRAPPSAAPVLVIDDDASMRPAAGGIRVLPLPHGRAWPSPAETEARAKTAALVAARAFST